MPRIRLGLPILLLLCFYASTASARTRAEQKCLELVEAMLSQKSPETSGIRRAIGLWQLEDLEDLSGPECRRGILMLLESISQEQSTALPLKRLATRMLVRRVRGKNRPETDAVPVRLGHLRNWWLAGPFAADSQADRTACSSATGIDIDARMQGKHRTVAWRSIPVLLPDGLVPLHDFYQPDRHSAACGLALLSVSKKSRVLFHIGCDDGCRVWVNDTKVLDDPGSHNHAFDQHCLAVTLPSGYNRVLFEVPQNEGAWSFSLAITSGDGGTAREIKVVADEEELRTALAAVTQRGNIDFTVEPTLASIFLERAKRNPEDPRALAEAALVSSRTGAADSRKQGVEHLVVQAVENLEDCTQACHETRLMLARLTGDSNLAVRLLNEVCASESHAADAHSALGLLNQIHNRPAKAMAAHLEALQADQDTLLSRLGIVELLQHVGMYGMAISRFEELLLANPGVYEVLLVGSSLYREIGNFNRCRELARAMHSIKVNDRVALRLLFELAKQAGEPKEALRWLDRLLETCPSRNGWLVERGDLLLHNGQPDDALKTFQRALEIRPGDPVALIRAGTAMQSQGRVEESIAAWSRALEVTPQDQGLQRRIEYHKEKKNPFYEPWVTKPTDFTQPGRCKITSQEHADLIRVVETTVVRLHANGLHSRYRQQVFRIMTRRGAQRAGSFHIEYAPGRQTVRILTSRIFRPDGEVDESILIDDFSLSEPWYNLYYDVHSRQISFPALSPGDVVELSYVIDDIGSQTLLDGYFGDLVPLLFAEPACDVVYVLRAPSDSVIGWNELPGQAAVSTETREGETVYKFINKVAARHAVEPEPRMPSFSENRAYLHLSTLQQWQQVAKWYTDLSSDQLLPGPEIERQAAALVGELDDEIDKIRAIYRFVADQTRYVGLEFGIHSYVPYRSSMVLTRKFGDCKDKAALMVSLLRQAGIEARLALVRTRSLGRIDPRPASLAIFNHAACYLPDQDLWLDATVPFHDISEIPAQDQGVQALVVDPRSTDLTSIPVSDPSSNLTHISFQIKTMADGRARVKSTVKTRGSLAPVMRAQFISGSSPETVMERSLNELFPAVVVSRVELENLLRPDLPLISRTEFEVSRLARTGKEGIELPILGRETSYQQVISPYGNRRYDLVLDPPWTAIWTVEHIPPRGYGDIKLPEEGKLESPFGKARLSFQRQGAKIIVRAEMRIDLHRVKALDYPAFRKFLGRVDRFFGSRLVFVPSPREPDTGEGHT